MFSLFTQARAGLPLSPGQRAFLKLVENVGWTALIAALGILTQYLFLNQQIDYRTLLWVVGGALILSILSSISKLMKANADSPMGSAIGALADVVATKVQASLPPAPSFAQVEQIGDHVANRVIAGLPNPPIVTIAADPNVVAQAVLAALPPTPEPQPPGPVNIQIDAPAVAHLLIPHITKAVSDAQGMQAPVQSLPAN